jgi:beta-phosphoglucomutase family hydrolase
MIKAVIFDMDGVVAETEHIHIQAEKKTMLRYGVRISEDELHEYTGTTARVMFAELIRKYKLDTTFEKIFDEKEEVMFKLLRKGVQPTKGVDDLILKLKHMKIKLAIASSSHRRMIEYVLNWLKIAQFFDSVVGAEDVSRSKPDPEIFLKTAQLLKVKPEECLVIEDSKLGVEAAKRAGMKSLGYFNPNSGKQDLSGADFWTDDFSKLNLEELLR